jgi:Tfp pilus assembly protein PilF
LEPVYSNGKSSVAFANNYALSLKATGDFKAARRVYEAALEKDSRNVSVLLNYAILLVENLGDKTKGQEAINRLKLLGTDTAIMEKAKQLEAKLK